MARKYKQVAQKRISSEVISGISDEEIQYVLFDRVWFRAGEINQNAMEFAATQSDGLRMVFHVTILDAEIGNGGFNQYFFNELDQFFDEQINGLGLIKATKHQDLLRLAASLRRREEQNAELQRLYEAQTMESFMATYEFTTLGECDQGWYALESALASSIVRYVRENAREFEL